MEMINRVYDGFIEVARFLGCQISKDLFVQKYVMYEYNYVYQNV